jgi:Leucine-rich repeat (LRR) protein
MSAVHKNNLFNGVTFMSKKTHKKIKIRYILIALIIMILVYFALTTVIIADKPYSIFTKEIVLNSLTRNDFSDKDLIKTKRIINLRWFQLLGGEVSNFDFLKEKNKLETLSISLYPNNKVRDFSPLQDLSNVDFFSTLNVYFSNLDDFKNMKNLTVLSIRYAEVAEKEVRITDISALKNLTNLQRLDLEETKCSDYSVLLEIESLKYLDIGRENLTKEQIRILEEKGVTVS